MFNNPIISETMSRNFFQFIGSALHFVDQVNISTPDNVEYDPGDRINPLIQKLNLKFRNFYIPDQNLTTDETIVGFQGKKQNEILLNPKANKMGIQDPCIIRK